ncbi:hypothetical protein K504DRAFT_459795 [Pleomassaria siparia CBS 279.74]|uniref:Methyltransferase domain-containing protein n=1 Tax=Pleomassaria siparia CBS 279.74 TaxID=1314801 RepID=A0A6G1K1V1_9PLEO|nr:hypothetical protein K504DRAFT_459795 [Pleomassaria siparia CBS 279.74]
MCEIHFQSHRPCLFLTNTQKEEEEEEEEEDEWRDRRVIPKTLAGACRNLLDEVLSTAGFKRETQSCEGVKGIRRSKFLIDLGFGCGDQTIYLNGLDEVSEVDKDSWVQFDYYVGITRDTNQCQVAKERVHEYHQTRRTHARSSWETPDIRLYCADAADPGCWSDQLQANMDEAVANTQEHWVLALDTLYHFSPSRWPVIDHMSRNLDASFMAFDLCLSPRASLRHRFMLRAITTLMGAPWANFVTVDQYRDKLVQAGYSEKNITIKDISHHVFEPLADFMVAQDGRLQVVGYGLGPFWVAQCMFAWWARSGIVRGVIVVAKK